MDGPAICTKPSERARKTTTSPRGVGKPVAHSISLVTVQSGKSPLAVAAISPFLRKTSGFATSNTTSLLSPSLPMLVTATPTPCA